MKKVFSKEAWIKDNIRTFGELGENGKRSLELWIPICEGKTAGEMMEMGYQTLEAWMIEVDDKEGANNE